MKLPDRQSLVLRLLKYVAMFEYRPYSEPDSVSVYDFVLSMAISENFNVDFIVEDYVMPEVLANFNYRDNLTSKQLEEFLDTVMRDYVGMHPSDVDYILNNPSDVG